MDAPATKTAPAGPRALCARSVDDCQLARRTVLESLASELGPDANVPATECAPSATASCTVMTDDEGAAANACTPDAATCDVLRRNLERDGKMKTNDCMSFPSSRLDLLAVRPMDFRM